MGPRVWLTFSSTLTSSSTIFAVRDRCLLVQACTTRMLVPDALIAATALEHSLELMTRNVRDFGQVPGLALQSSS